MKYSIEKNIPPNKQYCIIQCEDISHALFVVDLVSVSESYHVTSNVEQFSLDGSIFTVNPDLNSVSTAGPLTQALTIIVSTLLLCTIHVSNSRYTNIKYAVV